MLGAWWEALLDLVYPPRCPVCRATVDRHGLLCLACISGSVAEREINVAGRRLTALDSCRVVCDYAGGVRQLIHNLKFHQQAQAAAYLSRLLEDRFDAGRYAAVDAVVPVPLHAGRLAERGYNQTELIFRAWAEGQGWIWLNALERIRPTMPQWELTLELRRKNIKGAFKVTRPEWVQGKMLLVVDDILTSGFTLNEAARVLKRSGAKRVVGLALASGADMVTNPATR